MNATKNWDKFCSFLDKSVSICCGKFSLLPIEYFSSSVQMLKNGSKIYNTTQRDIFKRKFSNIDDTNW